MPLFDPSHKTIVHCGQILLVIVIMALSGARLVLSGGTARTGASSMGLGMGAKSLVIILYQLLSEHVSSFKKWASLKAYLILNSLEIVFWAAVMVLVLQGNIQVCEGTTCALGWVVVVLSVLMSLLSTYTATISYMDYRLYKAGGKHRDSSLEEGYQL
ncbi:hypothetical protein P175DRAFT_0531855 [Aspergillus ochraceoroseus IBT 24754]|uniref:MARVEL domain-containing protein n=1 Tax=Aspergillus ochraceoroseus IBT 24754 TaxID=1392256 RepID=A0A2T5LW58_9EURO|nr:uncharacterized protein P175DRAFT_0531855 [Aspergillus ochraceoroseus IBT 24754]PTU20517.1 hypothetical protein P175DRAFT_0531855 [Aspergillus ochraceoroseus IBT 24754]